MGASVSVMVVVVSMVFVLLFVVGVALMGSGSSSTGTRLAPFDDVMVTWGVLGSPPTLSGHIDDLQVSSTTYVVREEASLGGRRREVSHLELRLQARGPLAAATIWPPSQGSLVNRVSEEVRTGDPAFDGVVAVGSSDALAVLAQLDAPTRKVLAMGERPWFLRDGTWRTRFTDLPTPADLVTALRGGLARVGLGQERTVEEGLRALVVDDPLPSVRRRVLEEWVRLGTPPTALLGELAGEDDDLAVVAAEALGEEGLPALGRLLGAAATRREAALALARVLPAVEAGPELVVATETVLIAELEVLALRQVVAEALGRVGTVKAIPPLKGLAEREDFVGDAARQAVRAIQERITRSGRGAGSLSLVDAVGGELSLARPPRQTE